MIGYVIGGAAVALTALAIGGCGYYTYGTVKTLDIENITHVERVNDGSSSRYLVYTEDEGVLENTDEWLHRKTRSSDLYAKLQNAKSAKCEVYGWRFGLLSMYPNIIKCWDIVQKEDS